MSLVPLSSLTGTADYAGQPIQRDVTGLADPAVKLSVNLYGAPALSLKEFAAFEQDLIVGASLRVTAPLGNYDNTRLVNLGTHRWSFKPEIGVSKALGRWTVEAAAAVTLYTDNDDFFNGSTRSQDPLYSIAGHVVYSARSGIWGSLDLTYFGGGRTTIGGTLNNDLQQNWRAGWHACFPGGQVQLDQALRQQRCGGAHRQQLRPDRAGVAGPLGGGAVTVRVRVPVLWCHRGVAVAAATSRGGAAAAVGGSLGQPPPSAR